MATQRKVPTSVMVKGSDVAVPAVSGLVEMKTGGRAQVVSPGGKSSKVTVPVGLKPPLTVATSWMSVPTAPAVEGAVVTVGVAWVMLTGSSAQVVLTLTLLGSPL